PIHGQYRRPLISRFTPAAAAECAPHAREVVNRLIDGFIEGGEADLAQQLTIPLPAIVNTPVLGIPLEDRDRFQEWAVRLLASGGEDLEAIGSAMGYFDHLYEVRRDALGDDIPSLLIGLEIDGKPMDKTQFILTMIMLMTGGLDTTTNSGSHMLYYLAEHPEQRRLLVEEPDRIPAAVEELLRYLTPLPSLFRTAVSSTSVHGQAIAEGDRVQLCWMAANHDPAEFNDPDTVDLSRTPNRHFAFGVGEHRCLGANLARMELRVLLEEALPRLGEYRIVKQPDRYASVTRGISHLHAAFPRGRRYGGS
ncbi:cytochrome P450, partial [Micromonospora sp. WMMD736]|uniref:cytochrome P450 n=1 Tax=Micromonospora sp. WMMD736 TaxID=3404112 RepID=UPI003B95534B